MCAVSLVCGFVKILLWRALALTGGFAMGRMYYYYLLQNIPFPGHSGPTLANILSLLLGISNVVCKQMRCILVLLFPMYCGKPGRGVLKAMILTYIVSGPIRNMGLNAQEVVRVFACSTQLAHNLSRERLGLRLGPARAAARGLGREVDALKHAFRSIGDVIEALEQEMEETSEIEQIQYENDFVDDLFAHRHRSERIERHFTSKLVDVNRSRNYGSTYRKKLQYRCENQISHAAAVCVKKYKEAYEKCCELIPQLAEQALCWPLLQPGVCDLIAHFGDRNATRDVCIPPQYPGLGTGYEAVKDVKAEFVDKTYDINLRQETTYITKSQDFQEAKLTGERVQRAFKEKTVVMHQVETVMNICMALLFLRILTAAVKYHDLYLTSIDFDNLYLTGYFKKLDARREASNKYSLLPLKKMERNKYIDVYSLSYKECQRSNLMLQILKVMLEVVTATTFVMLDRLFFEALEVVRQHAEMEARQLAVRDLDIQVEGTGILASMLKNFLRNLSVQNSTHRKVSNAACIPHPRQMPFIFFLKIYGGYTWIVLLLFANPYTMRLKRLICSYFYPRREKERILHLYNDILKKRMKMHKTLRRRAVQSVRAHYLSGELVSLQSLRARFPRLLGWLRLLPAARMACLICGETQPTADTQRDNTWYSCVRGACPFVYCGECWREVGARCLACDPRLADLSDVDSHSDHEFHKY